MTNAEHIIAWIESSKPHYDALCALRAGAIADLAAPSRSKALTTHRIAFRLVETAISLACFDGDMLDSDVTEQSIYEAIGLVLAWKAGQ